MSQLSKMFWTRLIETAGRTVGRGSRIRVGLIVGIVVVLTQTTHAQFVELPSGFLSEPLISGLSFPTDAAFANEGLMFVAEKAGVVRVFANGHLLEEPFIDISSKVNNVVERGLVGIEVHPRFPEVPFIYLAFVYDPPEVQAGSGESGPDGIGARVSRLIRVSADPAFDYTRAVNESQVVLLGTNSTFEHIGNAAERNSTTPSCWKNASYVRDCLPADEISHAIGRVRFGPDGALYVGIGDGSSFDEAGTNHFRAQDLNSLAGKLLRIDAITGEGLANNPFFDGNPQSNASKVVNYGLRNPFSFTFDPETWNPIVGDVGWGSWEMIKLGSGHNFGWPCYEGGNGELVEELTFRHMEQCQELLEGSKGPVEPPAYAYHRLGTGGAIIVGDVYEAGLLPEMYQGALFFADYAQGWIRYLVLSSDGAISQAHDFGRVSNPVWLRVAQDGNLYYLNIWDGELVRIRYTDAEPQIGGPTIVTKLSPLSGTSPLVFDYDASLTYDVGGGPLDFRWDFAGFSTSTLAAGKTFLPRGEHIVRLTVTNVRGASSTAEYTVASGVDAPVATITVLSHESAYDPGDIIRFVGSGRNSDGSPIDQEGLTWRMLIHYDGHATANGLPPKTSGSSGEVYAADRGETALELCLTVTAANGSAMETCEYLRRR